MVVVFVAHQQASWDVICGGDRSQGNGCRKNALQEMDVKSL